MTTLRPENAEGVLEAVRWAAAEQLPLEVFGHGSKRGVGRPVQTEHGLDLSALTGVTLYEPEELVLSAKAGTPLADIEALLSRHRQMLAFEPIDFGPVFGSARGRGTIGGVLAANASGPRRIKAGAARDHVLGIKAVSGRGEAFKSGGRVVKNVTGYDLAKLYTGSLGTLGVIEGAWLRLKPRAERVLGLLAPGEDTAAALAACRRVARLSSARCVALVDRSLLGALGEGAASRAGIALVAELAGAGSVVEREAGWLRAELGAEPGKGDVLGVLRAWHAEAPSASFLRLRLSCRRSAFARVVEILRRASATVLAYPESSLLWARFPLEPEADEASAARPLRAVREALREGEGSVLLEALPEWLARGRDVFGDAPAALPLLRALKAKFDPSGVLNPGRFAAGL